MTKNQNQNIFFSNIGNQNIFLEKKHNPPCKLNGPSLRCVTIAVDSLFLTADQNKRQKKSVKRYSSTAT
jgi:hypothetical protein